MKVFLIIIAVLFVLIALLLSLSATITLIFDNGWHTTIQVLFIKKDIELSKIMSFILFPERRARQAKEKHKKSDSETENADKQDNIDIKESNSDAVQIDENGDKKLQKPNYIQKLWNDEGIVGIMLLINNFIETASSAVSTLIKGFHIYSLYVKIIVGGNDAADIANDYGHICGVYYPLKGIILNSMRVDQYDDYVQPDFIAPRNEYEMQLIGSLSVGLILKMVFKALFVFVKNFIKNK